MAVRIEKTAQIRIPGPGFMAWADFSWRPSVSRWVYSTGNEGFFRLFPDIPHDLTDEDLLWIELKYGGDK